MSKSYPNTNSQPQIRLSASFQRTAARIADVMPNVCELLRIKNDDKTKFAYNSLENARVKDKSATFAVKIFRPGWQTVVGVGRIIPDEALGEIEVLLVNDYEAGSYVTISPWLTFENTYYGSLAWAKWQPNDIETKLCLIDKRYVPPASIKIETDRYLKTFNDEIAPKILQFTADFTSEFIKGLEQHKVQVIEPTQLSTNTLKKTESPPPIPNIIITINHEGPLAVGNDNIIAGEGGIAIGGNVGGDINSSNTHNEPTTK